MRALDVDQPVPEHVPAEQHLAVPALEPAQAQPRAGQPQRVAVERGDLLDRHEHVTAAHGGDQPGDHRQVRAAEPDDHVGQTAERLAAAGRQRPLEQFGQVQRAGLAVPRVQCIGCRHRAASLAVAGRMLRARPARPSWPACHGDRFATT
jgi:hypothetical protein